MASDAPRESIGEFYAGRNIFITGATGFMGKVLVEKLLRSIPDIGTLYCLVRPKRDKTVEERKEEFLNSMVSIGGGAVRMEPNILWCVCSLECEGFETRYAFGAWSVCVIGKDVLRIWTVVLFVGAFCTLVKPMCS